MSYVAVGAFLVHYADLAYPVVSIIIGSAFILFGFVTAISAPIRQLPNWINRVEGWLAFPYFFVAVTSLIIFAIKDVIEKELLLYVVTAFIVLLPIIQLIDLIRTKRQH